MRRGKGGTVFRNSFPRSNLRGGWNSFVIGALKSRRTPNDIHVDGNAPNRRDDGSRCRDAERRIELPDERARSRGETTLVNEIGNLASETHTSRFRVRVTYARVHAECTFTRLNRGRLSRIYTYIDSERDGEGWGEGGTRQIDDVRPKRRNGARGCTDASETRTKVTPIGEK